MFLYSYIKKIVNYGLVIIIQFLHWLIAHDDETVISYIMPRHQTLKFSNNLKAKRYNVTLRAKINRNPRIAGIYLWLNEEIEHDEKVTLTPE